MEQKQSKDEMLTVRNQGISEGGEGGKYVVDCT